MSPFCSRLIISNYILAQKVVGQIRPGPVGLPPQLSEDARQSIFGETGAPWHCEEVQPARRESQAFDQEKNECQPPP
jgi:hypothetical protein